MIHSSNADISKKFLSSAHFQIGSRARTLSYSVLPMVFPSGVKRPGREVDTCF